MVQTICHLFFFKATHLSWRLKGFYILVHILNRLKLQVEKEHLSHLKYYYGVILG